MIRGNFTFKDTAGENIYVYKWLPDDGTKVKAVVQIAHGLAEHAYRYENFAAYLTSKGFAVYANDHRGHGKTAATKENLGYAGEDGFNWMVKDLDELNEIIKRENPNLPVFLFGHSMGSLISQSYIEKYGHKLKGVILSGTMGKQGIMLDIGMLIAKNEVKRLGPKSPSLRLQKMSFGSYNNKFKPVKTECDWLSRDEKEVDKYIKDEFCGFPSTTSFYYDFFKALKEIHKRDSMSKIPKELPIYIMNGDMDPVGSNCKTVRWLINEYKNLGIKDVEYKFYKDGRHEMLNEINKDEVMEDIINWLYKHI
ncbi:Lysophospholipase, alpha-beta hydrolase superfamily [Caloramator quimbayensis]|uniref:Lysophospholipase, alpha-beta hydrolase superfamily n=1 Tax=Caloramator quimbayensis TaxID=1147123 RepID=A0A1T4WW41_9CLOT|nr:alpha/beta hydrolase [Caloramator quimbayensis]SKA81469.1 Lysophospholipase, alpha-beta hydrolase superfamily [Caloramator quimbayensis]